MIEVMRHGDVVRMEARCHSCGCHFAYGELDMHGPSRMEKESLRWVKCPDCGQVLFVESPKAGREPGGPDTWQDPVTGRWHRLLVSGGTVVSVAAPTADKLEEAWKGWA